MQYRRALCIVLAALMLLTVAVAVTDAAKKSSSPTVYITNTGECYHRSGCSSLRRSKIAISKSKAVSEGYRACKRCKP